MARTLNPEVIEALKNGGIPRTEYLLMMSEVLQRDLMNATNEELDVLRDHLEWQRDIDAAMARFAPPMSRFRAHRGGYEDSMQTCVNVTRKSELAAEVAKHWKIGHRGTGEMGNIIVKYYGDDDGRGWKHTYIVTVEGYGPIGFTDGLPQD